MVGTFFLTAIGAGVEIVATLKPGLMSREAKAAAPALVVAAMIYSFGDVSGAHINPAVTTTFAVRGVFPWRRVPAYWLAQIVGATAAALGLRALFGTRRSVGVNQLEVSDWKGVAIEATVTALLFVVILNTAHKHSLIGTQSALAVGATVGVCGLVAGELTTASMNPARSIGPVIASGNATDLWVFIVGPLIGAAAALVIVAIIRPEPNRDEVLAAEGDEDKRDATDARSPSVRGV